jgi:serine/threonine protein phosphatase PrpC
MNTDADKSSANREVGWELNTGQVRPNNEDSLAVVNVDQASAGDAQSIGIYAVADGVGGSQRGEEASKLAVRTAVRQLMSGLTEMSDDETMPEHYHAWLHSAAQVANQVVYRKNTDEQAHMATTLVMAVVVGDKALIANVGDSRAYFISKDSIHQITEDHTLVKQLVDKGVITAEQAERHPWRNHLSKAVGLEKKVEDDHFEVALREGDSLLLCTDGLTGELSDADIQRIVCEAESPQAACEALVNASNRAGGRDNIAVVVVRLSH